MTALGSLFLFFFLFSSAVTLVMQLIAMCRMSLMSPFSFAVAVEGDDDSRVRLLMFWLLIITVLIH